MKLFIWYDVSAHVEGDVVFALADDEANARAAVRNVTPAAHQPSDESDGDGTKSGNYERYSNRRFLNSVRAAPLGPPNRVVDVFPYAEAVYWEE